MGRLWPEPRWVAWGAIAAGATVGITLALVRAVVEVVGEAIDAVELPR